VLKYPLTENSMAASINRVCISGMEAVISGIFGATPKTVDVKPEQDE